MVAAALSESDSTALPSGRAVSVTVNELRVAESTSVSVPTGAIRTGVCSVNAVVTSWPAPPPFRSTTGASFTALMTSDAVSVTVE